MEDKDIDIVMDNLIQRTSEMPLPIITEIKLTTNRNAFKILIATMLSLRTKDITTKDASIRLFQKADNPHKMLMLTEDEISSLIYPVGFYRVKASNILITCKRIIDVYGGNVPDTIDELLTLQGVGRKTANLVVTEAFDKDGICVDTHVHRISNWLGYVNTKNPLETEFALRDKLPKKYWRIYNDTFVIYGQNLCRPVSPKCFECEIINYCNHYKTKFNKKNIK